MLMATVSSWRTRLRLDAWRPCDRDTLQYLKTCSVVSQPIHSGRMQSSLFSHRTRFALESRRSHTDLMRKLIRSGTMCHVSFQVSWFLLGIILISPLSLLRLLNCLLDSSGIFITSNLIDDHVSLTFPFCFQPPLCYRWIWVSSIDSLILRHSCTWSVASTTVLIQLKVLTSRGSHWSPPLVGGNNCLAFSIDKLSEFFVRFYSVDFLSTVALVSDVWSAAESLKPLNNPFSSCGSPSLFRWFDMCMDKFNVNIGKDDVK